MRAKEDAEREDTAWRAAEAAEERADTKRRALKECLWETAGQQLEMVVVPPWVAKPSGRMTVGGPSASGQRASGVQDPCTQCHNKGTPCVLGAAKGKTMACEACHHAKQDSWDLGVAMLREMEAIADKLWRSNDLKEEEMGKSKGKGKEKAKEEFRRLRTDDDRDTEMGGAGPSSLA
ncbi:hypothetical protein ID866_11490 [Astraeus odoratus]|nr:hypothetical protein ID866_11490 [Astraeus odoratus]